LAEGNPRLPVSLPLLPAGLRQNRAVALLAEWYGLPLSALLGLVASLIYVLAPDTMRPIFDDSYISLTYARNLAEHGKLSFDGQSWSTGATSPLHVVIMAVPIALGFDPFRVSIGAGVLSHAALCVGTYLLAWAVFRSRLAALLAGLAIAFTSFAALDSGNGLETSLFMALLTFAMAAFLLFPTPAGRLLTGGLIALLIWTRPEGAFLIPAVLVYRWLERAEGETLRDFLDDALLLAAPGLFAIGTLALYSLLVNGTVSGTASAKWRFFQEDEQPLQDKVSAMSWNMGLFLGTVVSLIPLAALVVTRRPALLFALFWAPVVILYLELFPGGFGHYFYRYQHPMLPLLAVLAAGGAVYLIDLARRKRDAVVWGLVVVALAVAVVPMWQQYEIYKDNYKQASFETYEDLEQMVLDLNTIVRPDQTLATHDIGAVGYFGEFHVLDMVGLVNDAVIPFHEGRTFPRYFDVAGADYLLVFPEWDLWFFGLHPDEHPERFQLVKSYPGGPIRVSPYVLYRVLDTGP
jgi:hypothetical protein